MSDDAPPPLHVFQAYGIELEYMIVDRERLSVLPIADRLLRELGSESGGPLGWSNELVMHVVELKNLVPAASLPVLTGAFQAEVRRVDRLLGDLGARLMPGAMHPWMDPHRETRLWAHDHAEIYRTYDRIFDTARHGWANLQSMHINLPFCGDDEFARLHAAVRLLLPILPALAASSPCADGRLTGWADYRMHVYADNARHIPSITGMVIPENATGRADYEQRILAPMYADIALHDPERILQHEWLNSRGAIPRFDRSAIEIRVIDTQEHPGADLAIAAAAVSVVRMLYRDDADAVAQQQEVSTPALAAILQTVIHDAEQATIANAEYLRLLGFPGKDCRAGELWEHLVARMMEQDRHQARHWNDALQTILRHGPLARRILRAIGDDHSPAHLHAVYGALCDCLREGRLFLPAA